MGAKRLGNLTPSVEEFDGWYNIQDYFNTTFGILRSVEPLPDFDHGEFLDLYFENVEWFNQLVSVPPGTRFDPLYDGPIFVRDGADDRTLCVDADFALLTLKVLERIRKEFLSRYPLWRVVLVGEEPSCSIVVYPSAIRFGSQPLNLKPKDALRNVTVQQLALRAKRLRLRREHLEQVCKLLPEAVRAIDRQPLLVCGVIDNDGWNYSRLTICLLIRGYDEDAVYVATPARAGKDFIYSTSHFGLDAAGAIVSDTYEAPKTTPFRLVLWSLPAKYRGPLTIIERKTRRRRRFNLTSEQIISTRPKTRRGRKAH